MNSNTSLGLAAEAKLSFGERVVEDGCTSITQLQINELTNELIEIYNDGGFCYPQDLHSRAIEVAAEIAKQNPQALALVLEDAETRRHAMHTDDILPTRNSLEVLSKVCTPADAIILSFLTSAVVEDYGMPAWAAAQALNVVRARLAVLGHVTAAHRGRAACGEGSGLSALNAVQDKADSPGDILHAAIPVAVAALSWEGVIANVK